jgi:outer membrane protein TolC
MPVRRFVSRASVVAGVALLIACAARAETSGARLTEEKCLELGLGRPEVAALAEASRQLAESQRLEVSLRPNPVLHTERESVGDTTESLIGVSQAVDLSGRRRLQRDAAQRRVEAAISGNLADLREREGELRRLFYEVLHRQERLEATRLWARRLAQTTVAFADRRRLDRELALARSREGAERAAWQRRYQGLLARSGAPEGFVGVAGRLLPGDPLIERDVALAALPKRPALARLEHEAGAAVLERETARRERWPEVNLGLGYKSAEAPGLTETGGIVSLSVTLPLSRRGQAQELRAVAEEQRARSRHALELADARGAVNGLWHQARDLLAAAEELRRQLRFNPPELLIRQTETAYRNAQASVLELLDAHRSALDGELQALDLELDARLARVELDQLIGGIAP